MDNKRWAHLLKLHKMMESCNTKNLYNFVSKSLNDVTLLDEIKIGRKLICVRAYDATIMEGHRNCLCAKLQIRIDPYVIPIHCMAHKLNLAYNIMSSFDSVAQVGVGSTLLFYS